MLLWIKNLGFGATEVAPPLIVPKKEPFIVPSGRVRFVARTSTVGFKVSESRYKFVVPAV